VGLDRLAWRTLAARPLRTLLTILGVALGVGVLSASLTMSAGIEAAVDRTVRDVVGSADLRVSAFLEGGLSDATVQAIRDTRGHGRDDREADASRPEPGAAPAPDAVTVVGSTRHLARLHDPSSSRGAPCPARQPSALITETLAGRRLRPGSELRSGPRSGATQVIGILADRAHRGRRRAVLVPVDVPGRRSPSRRLAWTSGSRAPSAGVGPASAIG
jgi:hypothetical protein